MYLRIGQAAKLLGVSPTTMRRWEEEGYLMPALRTKGNHRRYTYKQVIQAQGRKSTPKTETETEIAARPDPVVIYARVSAPKQKEDLQRQIESLKAYAHTKGWEVRKVYSDIGSGINDQRKYFLKMITDLPAIQPTRILCTYKDRIARFGIAALEEISKFFGTVILPIETKTSGEQEELVHAILAILYSFSGKLYRRRRKKKGISPSPQSQAG